MLSFVIILDPRYKLQFEEFSYIPFVTSYIPFLKDIYEPLIMKHTIWLKMHLVVVLIRR